jgi:hypothetical protein
MLSRRKPYDVRASPIPASPFFTLQSFASTSLSQTARTLSSVLLDSPPTLSQTTPTNVLLGHRGKAILSPIEAPSDVLHFLVLILSPPSSTSGTHQFYCRIPPSMLVIWTTSLCSLDSPPNVVKAFREFLEVFSITSAKFRRLNRSKSASSSGTSNAPFQGVQHRAEPPST